MKQKSFRSVTATQLTTLEFIQLYIDKHKQAPTYQEIAAAFNITPTAAHERVARLHHHGYVKQGRNHRDLVILKRVENGTVS